MTPDTSTMGGLPRETRRRLLALLGAFALMFTLVAPIAPVAASHGDGVPDDIATDRLAGENRNETACDIALDTFEDGSETVIVTRGDDFPDTLAGNYLASQLDVPILLTPDFDFDPEAVDPHTERCLDELGTTNVVILGGPDAVPQSVEDELAGDGFDITRIGGADREETARLVATGEEDDFERTYGETDEGVTAIVARADHFVDALSAGPSAYAGEFPILLTRSNEWSDEAEAALNEIGAEHVLISGGTAAVSDAVELQITATTGATTERVAGEDRAETATEWVDWTVENFGWDRSHVNLARGDFFPDALTLGTHAAIEQSGIIVSGSNTSFNTPRGNPETWVRDHACEITSAHIAGGLMAISQEVQDDFEDAANDCPVEDPALDGIDLQPEESTNEPGDDHELTATLQDQFGDAFEAEDFVVLFEVTGTNQLEATATTDDSGQAVWDYTSTEEGEDTITACVNNDGSTPDDCADADHSATATKTWEDAPPPPLDADDIALTPEEATNSVNEEHDVTATVTFEDDPVEGAQVLFEVTGANSDGGAEATDADGNAFFAYTGTQAGTDTIFACTNEDGTLPDSCDDAELVDEATKHWEPVEPTDLVIDPQEATNPVEDTHEVTVTATDADDEPVQFAWVRLEVTGTTTFEGTALTDDEGNVHFEYTSDEAGTDSITACANLDGSLPEDCADADITDDASKVWQEPEVDDLFFEQDDVTNLVGTSHTAVVTAEDQFERGYEGALVRFEVRDEAGTLIEVSPAEETDSDGEADFTYEGPDTEEIHQILACTTDDGSAPAACTGAFADHIAEQTKNWTFVEDLTFDVAETTNAIGDEHEAAVTVTDSNGDPIPGVVVLFEVTSTSEAHAQEGTRETNEDGVATFSYVGQDETSDTITACTMDEGTEPDDCDNADHSDTQTKHWIPGPGELSLSPQTSTNEPGDQHFVTVQVTDTAGAPMDGIEVRFDVHRDGSTSRAFTDTGETVNGEVEFDYTSLDEATDTLFACVFETQVEGDDAPTRCTQVGTLTPRDDVVHDEGTKIWEIQ